MARYDLHDNPAGDGYLLDVQADVLDLMKTRVVIPLLPAETTPPVIPRLHPVFAIGDHRYVLATHLVSAVPVTMLGEVRTNLSVQHDKIVAALDMLFQGF